MNLSVLLPNTDNHVPDLPAIIFHFKYENGFSSIHLKLIVPLGNVLELGDSNLRVKRSKLLLKGKRWVVINQKEIVICVV